MPESVRIERLTEQNANWLDERAAEVFDNPIRADSLAAFLADPRHVMFFAREGTLVVGMASAVEYFHPDKSPQLWINEVGVSPSHRRRGIGRRLVQALIEHARARGCVYAWLGTDQDNQPAQACFSSVPDGEPAEAFLLYEWELIDSDADS